MVAAIVAARRIARPVRLARAIRSMAISVGAEVRMNPIVALSDALDPRHLKREARQENEEPHRKPGHDELEIVAGRSALASHPSLPLFYRLATVLR